MSLEEEVEMVLSMFTDECVRDPDAANSIRVHLPFRFELHVALPPSGYPDSSHPQLFVAAGPNAQLVTLFSAELHKRMRDEVPLGCQMLIMLIHIAQTLAEEMKADYEAETQAMRERERVQTEVLQEELEEMEALAIDVWSGEPIADRKSKFVAHMAPVRSETEVRQVIEHLLRNRSIAMACHPTIWAYRFTDERGILHADCDDDGESGASVKMMFLLENLNVDGYMVVVTRWFGGILLGPDRFKHIMEVTKKMLITIPEREQQAAASAKAKGRR